MRKKAFYKHLWSWGAILILLVGGYRLIIFTAGKVLTNTGLLIELHSKECPPDNIICRLRGKMIPLLTWEGNHRELTKAERLFNLSTKMIPSNSAAQIHYAENLFSLGERQKASNLISKMDLKINPGSPLFDEGRYEYHLLKAFDAYDKEDWEKALYHFRLGLFWGGENILTSDEDAYLHSLAYWTLKQAGMGLPETRAKFRAGAFLAFAGDWVEAVQYLKNVITSNDLLPYEKAQAFNLLAISEEQNGKFAEALRYYQAAYEIDPTNRDTILRLINIYSKLGKSDYVDSLSAKLSRIGPEFHLGIIGNYFKEERPTLFENGWKLIGYDTDENFLEDLHKIDVILWWELPAGQNPPDNMTPIGEYWLQRQEIVNLMPNPGMEWGLDERGIPLGHKQEGYAAPEGILTIGEVQFDNQTTHVLLAKNTPDVRRVSLVSKAIIVNQNNYMLMSGWLFDQERTANIGRECGGKNYTPGRPYYLGDSQILRPVNEWIFMASVAKPMPGKEPEYCQILLINFESSSAAMWDKLLWASIDLPWNR